MSGWGAGFPGVRRGDTSESADKPEPAETSAGQPTQLSESAQVREGEAASPPD